MGTRPSRAQKKGLHRRSLSRSLNLNRSPSLNLNHSPSLNLMETVRPHGASVGEYNGMGPHAAKGITFARFPAIGTPSVCQGRNLNPNLNPNLNRSRSQNRNRNRSRSLNQSQSLNQSR